MEAVGDPRIAVIDFLTAPAGRPASETADASASQRAMAVSRVAHGKSFRALPDTIEFLKERGGLDRRLFAVRFDDGNGLNWFWLVAAERDEHSRWHAHGVAGGAGSIPQRPKPWLNFCGGWGRGWFYGGGQIHDAGVALGRISVTLENGTRLDDDAEAGVALFVAEEESGPERITLFDASGNSVGAHRP